MCMCVCFTYGQAVKLMLNNILLNSEFILMQHMHTVNFHNGVLWCWLRI